MQNVSAARLFLQRHRVLIGRIAWPLLILYVFAYQRIPTHPLLSEMGLYGVGIITLGLLIRSLSAGALHKNDVLATEGIYAVVRNPLYLGSLILLLGLNVIVADSLFFMGSVAIFAITHIPTILNEEQGLARVFGAQWEAFTRSTPRLFPNLLKLGALKNTTWNFSQWYKNHEHNTIIAALVILAALQLYQQFWAQA